MNNFFMAFPPLMFIFIFIIIIIGTVKNGRRKKVVLKEEIVNKYKSIAYDLINNNPEFEKARSNYKIQSLFAYLFLGLSFASMFVFVQLNVLFGILGFILCMVTFIIIISKRNDKAIFNNVLPKVLNRFNSDIIYDHYKKMDRNVYREARYESFDRYSSDDYITGKVHNCPYEMAEVHTERRHTDSKGRTHYSTIFHGMFAKITLSKSFDGYLSIVNNKIKLFNRDQYITIDNEAFEKIYDVFTDDKIKAMRLLTPDVTTKMIDLYNETGIYCEVKIMNNLLYIRLYTGAFFNLSFSNAEKEALMVGKSLPVIDSVFKIMENFIKEVEEFDV